MGIFGQLDAAAIPSNAFFIKQGEYPAEVTLAEFQTNKDDERMLVIEYTINDESSEFDGQKQRQRFVLIDSAMTQEMFEELSGEEKKTLRNRMTNLKRTLCGNGSFSKGLGVDINDLNDPEWNPSVLMGLQVIMAIKNFGAENTGTSINYVNIVD